MTRKQIEIKASSYIAQANDDDYAEAGDIKRAFIDGARWRINSVWHDVSEQPEANRHYLVLYRFEGEMFTKVEVDLFTISQETWDLYVSRERVMSWAYVEDLLPERKEEI